MSVPSGARRLYLVTAIEVVGVALCLLLVVVFSGTFNPIFPRELSQVKDDFHSAMVLELSMGNVNPQERSLSDAIASPLPTSAQLEQTRQKAVVDLARYFSPDLVARLWLGVNNAIAVQQDPNQRLLGDGVSDIDYRYVVFNWSGSKARLRALVTGWSAFAQKNPNGTW